MLKEIAFDQEGRVPTRAQEVRERERRRRERERLCISREDCLRFGSFTEEFISRTKMSFTKFFVGSGFFVKN